MVKKTKIEKFHLIITIIFILQCIEDFYALTWSCFWFITPAGFEPLYGVWFEYGSVDIVLIILLSFKKLRLLGMIGILYSTINAVFFLGGSHPVNPMLWLKNGRTFWAIGIFLWYIEIVLALVGIFLWWWQLRGRRVRANHA